MQTSMNNNMLRITRYCSTSRGQAYINGKPCLDKPEQGLDSLLQHLVAKYNVFHPRFGKMDRLCQLGFTVSEILIQGIELERKYGPYNIGIILNNSSSSLDTDIRYNDTVEKIPSPALFIYTLPNILIAEICIRNNFKGEHHFFISKEHDKRLLCSYITDMFAAKRFRACIGGRIEVLKENYCADLFLVEETVSAGCPEFSIENLEKLYKHDYIWNS